MKREACGRKERVRCANNGGQAYLGFIFARLKVLDRPEKGEALHRGYGLVGAIRLFGSPPPGLYLSEAPRKLWKKPALETTRFADMAKGRREAGGGGGADLGGKMEGVSGGLDTARHMSQRGN